MSTMQTVINTVFKNREKRKKYMLILLSLSVMVAIAVSIILITPADSKTGQLICGMEEHTHAE